MAEVNMNEIREEVYEKHAKTATDKQSLSEIKENKPEDKQHLEKAISGSVSTKDKSRWGKFKSSFFVKDIKSVGNYIWQDVLIPAFKSTISDMVGNGVDRLLYGDEAPRRGSSSTGRHSTNATYVSYNSMSSRNRVQSRDPARETRGLKTDYILESREDAEVVLERLRDAVEVYGMASVDDLKDLIGETGDYTDRKWGWSNLRDAGIQRVRDGWMLVLPRVEYLN